MRRLLISGGSFTGAPDMQELAYAENTSGPLSVTSTSFASPDTLVTAPSVTFSGSLKVIIETGTTSIIPPSVSEWINLALYEDGAFLGILGGSQNDDGVTSHNIHVPFYATRRMIPSAGAHVYSIGAVVAIGTGQINFGAGGGTSNDFPAYIRIVTAG